VTTAVDPDVAVEMRRLRAAAEHARAVCAARLSAAGIYVRSLRCLSGRQRRELLALLYGHRDAD
jgi:hypothetical protein